MVAEAAEIPFTAFSSRKKSERVEGRLVVRRIPELSKKGFEGQPTLFDTHCFHGLFTTSDLDTVTADKTHRGHAIIEQINADLRDSALALGNRRDRAVRPARQREERRNITGSKAGRSPCPPETKSDQTRTTSLTAEDRWIEAEHRLLQPGRAR